MATYKIEFVRSTTITGYVEAATAQDAVDKVYYPHDKDSDGNITERYAPGDGGFEISNEGRTNEITSLTDVSGGDAAVSPIPTAVIPTGF